MRVKVQDRLPQSNPSLLQQVGNGYLSSPLSTQDGMHQLLVASQ
jgi:hypothetical protein